MKNYVYFIWLTPIATLSYALLMCVIKQYKAIVCNGVSETRCCWKFRCNWFSYVKLLSTSSLLIQFICPYYQHFSPSSFLPLLHFQVVQYAVTGKRQLRTWVVLRTTLLQRLPRCQVPLRAQANIVTYWCVLFSGKYRYLSNDFGALRVKILRTVGNCTLLISYQIKI
jgi:hypothetical protein